mgnify:CR=1 FL=1|tara:strand:+ start:5047 stop:5658 length:612 start_codon:yes stop_codon:yes gene_type:complete
MFTGIVEEIGVTLSVDSSPDGATFHISSSKTIEGLQIGDSVCVNGVCVTVIAIDSKGFWFDAIPETLQRSNLGNLEVGQKVNLESPLGVDGRFSGHFVQGHVDGLAKLVDRSVDGESLRIRLKIGDDLIRYIVSKGYVALDGASLTVVEAAGDCFEVALVPHTIDSIVMASMDCGYLCNVEVDIVAKYVESFMVSRNEGSGQI